MKTLEQLRSDPRIDEISDERRIGNGWFVYLKGYAMYPGTGEAHCFAEDTLKEVQRTLKTCVRCECEECQNDRT